MVIKTQTIIQYEYSYKVYDNKQQWIILLYTSPSVTYYFVQTHDSGQRPRRVQGARGHLRSQASAQQVLERCSECKIYALGLGHDHKGATAGLKAIAELDNAHLKHTPDKINHMLII